MLTEPVEVGVERLDEFREPGAETGARPARLGVEVDVVAAGELRGRDLRDNWSGGVASRRASP